MIKNAIDDTPIESVFINIYESMKLTKSSL